MKILVVSFDNEVVERIKTLLAGHQLDFVKNSEDAKLLPEREYDFIVFDAVGGSFSEEEINQLHQSGFRGKYVILIDELFPVNLDNLLPPQKYKLSRTELNKLPNLLRFIEEGGIPKEEEEVPLELGGKKKVLVISFETDLVNTIKNILGEDFELIVAKTAREGLEKGKDADIIIYDTISGIVAEKGLKTLVNDENFKDKIFLVLLDEIFPISLEGINAKYMDSLGRESELSSLVEKMRALLARKLQEEGSKTKEKSEETPTFEVTEEEKGQTLPFEVGEEEPKEEGFETFTFEVGEETKEEQKEESFEASPFEVGGETFNETEEFKVEEEGEKPKEETPTSPHPEREEDKIKEEVRGKVGGEEMAKKLSQIIEEVVREEVAKAIVRKIESLDFERIVKEVIKEKVSLEELESSIRKLAVEEVRRKIEELLS